MSRSLSNPSGIRISELVNYLQKQWLNNGCDGLVLVAVGPSDFHTISQVTQLDIEDVLLTPVPIEATLNPCINIYEWDGLGYGNPGKIEDNK